jgi:hypothetical protein
LRRSQRNHEQKAELGDQPEAGCTGSQHQQDGLRGHHRFTDKSHVANVEGNQARLSANADVAVTMEKLFVSRSVTPRRQTASTCFNRRRPSELRRMQP